MYRAFSAFILILIPTFCRANDLYLFQKPALSRTQVVFVFAGDLWSVPREGGEAVRLTAGAGVETNPVFSPDGTMIAFTGEYEGNVDVYVMPAAGGTPRRLTYHPAPDFVLAWTPDGKRILFSSNRTSYSRFSELFTISIEGGFPEKVPLPMGYEAAYSPEGKRLAYVPLPRAFTVWKRYRGGRTTPIWIADLATSRIEKVPRENSNDFNPMWVGERIYFLSDRNGPVTLFGYDLRTRRVSQLLPNGGPDLKSASAGPGAIVYEQFGGLYLYDLSAGTSRRIPIRIAGDFPELRPRLVKVGARLRNAHISPTGARAVFEARGEILTVPAEKGDPRNLTNSPGVMDRDPAWSPDGSRIAWFSDESGEYQLHVSAQDGSGHVLKIALADRPTFYFSPRWSPDGKKIAYIDCHLGIWYVDLESKKAVLADKGIYWSGHRDQVPVWSPDGKWLAYSKRLENHLGAIFLYSLERGKPLQVTDGMSDARHPVFDRDGKYLYFTASTDSGPSLQPDLHSFVRRVTRTVYLAVLAKDEPSPLRPESDEEKPPAKPEPKPETRKPGELPAVRLDPENLGQRILALPLPPRLYSELQVGKAGVLFAVEAPLPAPGAEPSYAVHRFDLKSRKSDVVLSGVRFFEISANGEKMLYRQQDRWYIAPLRPMAAGPSAGQAAAQSQPQLQPLRTDNLELRVDPRQEWRQMYREAWRIEREFFYDPGYHGLDLKAAEKRYEPYLDNIASRADLNYLFAEMLGEMSVGHLNVGGGDMPEVRRVETGLLGADFELADGRYRFARIFSGENWNPQLRAPLTEPGVNVAVGEYLLAVNGRELRASDNVYAFFEGTAGKQVVLRVGPDPTGAGAREVTVVPVAGEAALRNMAWVEENRRKVEQATGGRVAYIYMPDTAFGGLTFFNRYFFAQAGKQGAIIDERFNGGGMLATDIIEHLSRRLLSAVATRDGKEEIQPQGLIFGPKVMIINEFAGSGGDAMPWYFRRAGVGKLIGKKTWGGLVGRAGAPELMDGGTVTAPSSGVFNPISGQWEVENIGVAPDIEVELDPEAVRQGRDPQLEKAIEVVLAELKKTPPPAIRRPPYPNYHAPATAGTKVRR